MEEEPLEDENSVKDGSYYVGNNKQSDGEILSPKDDDFSDVEVKETINTNTREVKRG